jgi:membrane protein YqaA with SNARE-associated domain
LVLETLEYLEVTLIAFLVNLVPALAPPTWVVLSVYQVNHLELNSLGIAFFGVIGSVAGRFVMYQYSALVGRHVPRKQADNLRHFRELVEEKRLGLFFGTLVYSLSPLPSNYLFITSGISGMELLPVIGGFAVGRFISYAFLVYASSRAYAALFGIFDISRLRLAADILGIVIAGLTAFVDWSKIFDRSKKPRQESDSELREPVTHL